jgi:hypothetical protein
MEVAEQVTVVGQVMAELVQVLAELVTADSRAA